MSGRFVRSPTTPSRRAAIALVLLAALLSVAPTEPLRSFPVRAAAPTPSLSVAADRAFAGLEAPVGFAAWLNLSGAGVVQTAWVNITRDSGLLVDLANATVPAECTPVAAPPPDLRWECANLRAGSFAWRIPMSVAPNATVGVDLRVNATAMTLSGGTYASAGPAFASVSIVSVAYTLRIDVYPPGKTEPDPAPTLRPGDYLDVSVIADYEASTCDVNLTECTALSLDLSVTLAPWLLVDAAAIAPRHWENVSGQQGFGFRATVAPNATAGDFLAVMATLEYRDFDGRALAPQTRWAPLKIEPPAWAFTLNVLVVLVGAMIALSALLAARAASLWLGQSNLRIEELFLMHRSGILIQHASRTSALQKDDELVASMLVAVQDFVKDSFRTEGALDEFRFSGRRAALVRGRDTILAAIISKGDVGYLVPQLREALQDVERAHGGVLAEWDGRMSRLDRVGPILEALLSGEYRASRAWKGLVGDARVWFRRGR